jgi:PKD repeat protein
MYYRRLSADYSDTSNWFLVLYVPKPSVTNLSAYSICSGTTTSIPLTATAACSFKYTVVTTIFGTTGASSDSNNTISQTLVNPSNNLTSGIVYRVVPTSLYSGCVGFAKDITVNVLPKPQITTISSYSMCSGTPLTIPLTASVASTFIWTKVSSSSTVSGAKDSSGSSMVLNLFNSSNTTSGTSVYAVKARSLTGDCQGNSVNFTVSVRPLPVITKVLSDTICSGLVNEQFLFQYSIPSTLAWTPIQSQQVTGAQSGAAWTMRQSLVNSSTSMYGYVDYLVDLTSSPGDCTNPAQPLRIYVAPIPKINEPSTKLICNGSNTNLVPNTDYPGMFTWRLGAKTGNVTGSSAQLQLQPGIFQTLTNADTTTGAQVYLVKHILKDAQCTSAEKAITILVSRTSNQVVLNDSFFSVCSGTMLRDTLNATPNASFAWKPITNSSITGALADSGSVFQQVLTLQEGQNTAVQEFELWPYLGTEGCIANPLNLKVQVNENPRVGFSYTFLADTFSFFPSDTNLVSYLWSFGDSNYSTLKFPKHTYTQAGIFAVKLTAYNSSGCSTTTNLSISYSPVGLTELDGDKFWKVYPNPAQQEVYIQPRHTSLDYSIKVRDVLGRVLLDIHANSEHKVDVSEWNNGLYFITIQSALLQHTKPLLIAK